MANRWRWWVALAVIIAAAPAGAWGPHPDITRAALAVLPEAERWKAEMGAANLAALAQYCWMPDEMGRENPAFFIDDYLLIRAQPTYMPHVMPDVRKTIAPCFKRALQALRTETPVNACRQIAPLLHFVEDIGAPPHAAPKAPKHIEMET